jgi:CRP-like cAMP-binding protein
MPQKAQYRDAIREQPLFAALDDEQFERVERRTQVVSLDARLVLAVPNAEYRAVLAESPPTCLRLLAELSRRLHGLVREIEELTLSSATNRFVRHVLDLAGSPPPGAAPVTVTLPESKQMLASRLAIKPETLSRILRTLNDAGVVTVDGRSIHVPDLDRLRSVA